MFEASKSEFVLTESERPAKHAKVNRGLRSGLSAPSTDAN